MDDDKRSKSSLDIRASEPPTPSSKRKRFWNSLKNTAKKRFRSRSRDKSSKYRSADESRLTSSQPDISDAIPPTSPATDKEENHSFFESVDIPDVTLTRRETRRSRGSTRSSRLDEPISIAATTGVDQPIRGEQEVPGAQQHHPRLSMDTAGRSEDKESEQDSGIAGIDQLVSNISCCKSPMLNLRT